MHDNWIKQEEESYPRIKTREKRKEKPTWELLRGLKKFLVAAKTLQKQKYKGPFIVEY